MTPDICQVKHDPPNSYGDCIRACVASLLDLPTLDVPHFVRDGAPGHVMQQRLREWLAPRGLVPMFSGFPASDTPDPVLEFMGAENPGVPYILFSADHAVVCRGGEIIHNPAWVRTALVPPADMWCIVTLVALCE